LLLKLRKYYTVQLTAAAGNAHVRSDENIHIVVSLSQDNMNGHVKSNMGMIFRSVLMLYSKTLSVLSTPLEIQITKVGEFFSETHCITVCTATAAATAATAGASANFLLL